jgi:hypothetical protein
MLEYPAYSSWSVGVTWNSLMWAFMISACFFGRSLSVPNRFYKKSVLLAGSLILFGLTPYFGLRNYPAFAMFSNLQTEGDQSNHLIFRNSWDMLNYQNDTVEILESDIPSVKDMQVNLGFLFHEKTLKLLDRYNLSSEFYIVPPKWHHHRELPFIAFEVPVIELRRRLSTNKNDGFVTYRRNGGEVERYETSCTDRELTAPLNLMELMFVRFRTFDRNYSPCRH